MFLGTVKVGCALPKNLVLGCGTDPTGASNIESNRSVRGANSTNHSFFGRNLRNENVKNGVAQFLLVYTT
jgi:hypothetical protein